MLFVDTGLSVGQISGLFAIWSAVAVLAEVPTGALADRYSRRGALVVAGLTQASAFAVWTASPSFAGFAVGFVLWGVAGSLVSGAFEALVYDGLVASGARDQYARVSGWISAAGLVGQLPAAGLATLAFSLGGYTLAGWLSVGLCVGAAALACMIPEAARSDDSDEDGLGYVDGLRVGLREAATNRAVRAAVVGVALVTGLDALEEYFPLLARDWDVETQLVPAALLGIVLAGAAGAALGARLSAVAWPVPAAILAVGGAALGLAALLDHPAGLAVVALFYGTSQAVEVAADIRLQHRIATSSRATVLSVAALGTEAAVFAVYAAWAVGGARLSAALVCLTAALVVLVERPHGRRQ